MHKSTTADVKRERKKALYLRELSLYIDTIAEEQPAVREIYLSRLELSADGGMCYLYFATITPVNPDAASEERFKAALEVLKLYKPSMRKALAHGLQARYTPDLYFMFDEKREKLDRINALLDQVQNEIETAEKEKDVTD